MKISRTNSFKRDYKRLIRKHKDTSKLEKVIRLILNGENQILYHQYNDHFLKGNYKGYRECHIEKDWLLIYKNALILVLTRTGSYDELF